MAHLRERAGQPEPQPQIALDLPPVEELPSPPPPREEPPHPAEPYLRRS